MSKNIVSKVLIIDDVPDNIKMLRNVLEPEGYSILVASDGETALRIAERALPDIILLDIIMPVMDGYEVCQRLKSNQSTEHIPVIFVTIKDDSISLKKAFQVGGVDYIPKPFEKEEVLARVESHLKISFLTHELIQKNKELQEEISRREQAEEAHKQAFDALQIADEQLSIISQQEASRWGIEAFIGKSNTIKKILDDVRLLQSIGTTSVLITGESGTGKELIARAIHFGGVKSRGPFIPVNCSAITKELAESTFFGHVRGAFSGANSYHKGYFEQANGGTLFLDEIGDMPIELQAKLLRVIEDGLITPIGSEQEKHVDVRILAATNQDLKKKIAEGSFRNDLYFRLENYQIRVPPLRERKEDIPLLVEHFLKIFSEGMGIANPSISSEAMLALENYQYPGNVRELRNIIERALLKSRGSIIKLEHLQFIDANNIQHTNTQPSLNINNSLTDEERILAYIRQNGSITNTECRELLLVDRRRASYLLEKMTAQGLLKRKSSRRWTQYLLSAQ
ncbi:sigma-54-dependent Fis family transcriptional regulator [Candidatus Poribacteria bacterium]|nr:sigma-54-dependent Fis family transcriptional regulator [Candidatus Poribacteria bacterium]